MEIEMFKLYLKNCKTDTKITAQHKLKVTTNKEKTEKKIFTPSELCKCCGNMTGEKGIRIKFKKPQKLSIFHAGMLYSLYILQKKPKDYASYHKCVAGKRFIENIENIGLILRKAVL